jgi:hypothetical protein
MKPDYAFMQILPKLILKPGFFVMTICVLFTLSSKSQTLSLKPVDGLFTKEIYCLFADSKGFIWVGHNLGISRFDGSGFTNFSNNLSTSLSITDIAEDKEGRIWCHNFTGQIFYIENERMHLLRGYNPSGEIYFPRIVICGDELIATTSRGLFVCNTLNLKCRYLQCINDQGKAEGTRSITKLKDRVIVNSETSWYSYDFSGGVQKLIFKNNKHLDIIPELNSLQPFAEKDTVFFIGTPSAILYRLMIKGDTIQLLSKEKMDGMINNVTCSGKQFWINTRNISFTSDGKYKINNYNLTDIINDYEGNTWYSSLTKGLLVNFKKSEYGIITLPKVKSDDFIRCLYQTKNLNIYGTQRGEIIVENSTKKQTIATFDLSHFIGEIEDIIPLSGTKYIIRPSVGLYILDVGTKELHNISPTDIIKGVEIYKNSIFLATTKGIKILPLNFSKNRDEEISREFRSLRKNKEDKNIIEVNKSGRCNAICMDTITHTLYAAFIDGLFLENNTGLHPLLNNGSTIHASSLAFSKGKLFVSTFSNDLLIIKNKNITHLNTRPGSASTPILKMKIFNNHLWLLGAIGIRALNIAPGYFLKNISLPSLPATNFYNVTERNNFAYLISSDGVYKIDLTKTYNSSVVPLYLLYGLINNRDTIKENTTLSYNQNDVTFYLASPSFSNSQSNYFQYRLLSGKDTNWLSSAPGQKIIHYASLRPGNYVFQAQNVNPGGGVTSKKVISYGFIISKPFWQQWWFYLLYIVGLSVILIQVINQRISSIRKKNNLLVEKLRLEKELANSTLTAIKSQLNPHFIFNILNTIQSFIYTNEKEMANNYLGKISNLMRKILEYSGEDYITLKEEIELLQLYIDLELLRNNNNFISSIEVSPLIDLNDIHIPPMLIQPYIENAIKHGLMHKNNDKKLNIRIQPSQQAGFINIQIEDNGVGREKSKEIKSMINIPHQSFANTANEKRIALINQSQVQKIELIITDKKNPDAIACGTIVQILLPFEEINKSLKTNNHLLA